MKLHTANTMIGTSKASITKYAKLLCSSLGTWQMSCQSHLRIVSLAAWISRTPNVPAAAVFINLLVNGRVFFATKNAESPTTNANSLFESLTKK